MGIYRRTDTPGLWASYARIAGDGWVNDAQLPLWGHDRAGTGNLVGGENLSRAFTTLKFGLPAGLLLPDGQVFVAFWCVEECIYTIRWFRLPSQPPVEDRESRIEDRIVIKTRSSIFYLLSSK